MGPFSFVVAIVAVVCVGRLIRQYLDLRHKRLGLGHGELLERLAHIERSLAHLHARVENLETIVTDPRQKLRTELDGMADASDAGKSAA